MRPAQLQAVLDREFMSARVGYHTPVMLWGAPGVGKSQIIAQVATRHEVPVIDIRLSQMEPSDLRGIPFRINNFVEWAVPSMLPDLERHGAEGPDVLLARFEGPGPPVTAGDPGPHRHCVPGHLPDEAGRR